MKLDEWILQNPRTNQCMTVNMIKWMNEWMNEWMNDWKNDLYDDKYEGTGNM